MLDDRRPVGEEGAGQEQHPAGLEQPVPQRHLRVASPAQDHRAGECGKHVDLLLHQTADDKQHPGPAEVLRLGPLEPHVEAHQSAEHQPVHQQLLVDWEPRQPEVGLADIVEADMGGQHPGKHRADRQLRQPQRQC